jgi:hypothetical protein
MTWNFFQEENGLLGCSVREIFGTMHLFALWLLLLHEPFRKKKKKNPETGSISVWQGDLHHSSFLVLCSCQ